MSHTFTGCSFFLESTHCIMFNVNDFPLIVLYLTLIIFLFLVWLLHMRGNTVSNARKTFLADNVQLMVPLDSMHVLIFRRSSIGYHFQPRYLTCLIGCSLNLGE